MKPMKSTLFLFFAFFLTFPVLETQAQDFEGIIRYEFPDVQNSQTGEMAYMIKGSKVRMEVGQENQSAVILYLTDKSEMVVIVPQMKGYMKTKMNQGESGSGNGNFDEWEKSKMRQTGQSKTIAGHSCEVWEVENDEGTHYTLCMAKGLGTFVTPGNPMSKQSAPEWARRIAEQEYMPLEVIETKGDSETLQMRATAIAQQSLDASLFEIPEGYRDMSAMMKQMQNKNQQ